MTALIRPRMTVDEYLAWAVDQPGHHELFRSEVFPIPPAGVGHTRCKGTLYSTLLTAVRQSTTACHLLPDGMAVRIDDMTAHEPDALVYCGNKLPNSAIEVPNPLVVFEVLSPWACLFDTSIKLPGYFKLKSLAHYLIVDPTEPMIVHHSRASGGDILTRVVTEGVILLDPPGLELAVADIYSG